MGAQHTYEAPSLPIHHQLTDIWKRSLGLESISIAESFFLLGGTPSAMRQMLEDVKSTVGESIDASAFLKDPTIKGLAEFILVNALSDPSFVPLQKGNGRKPFYFFHGDILGGGFYTKRLAALLGREQPFHVSAPAVLDGKELPSLEQIAAHHRHALQSQQLHGPYLLGGFCVGAVIAYEVARQLQAAGETVNTVLLIEPEIGDGLTRSYLRVVDRCMVRRRGPREKVRAFMRGLTKIERLRHVWRSPRREKAAFLSRKMKRLFSATHLRGVPPHEPPNASTQDPNRDWLLGAYHWVLASYRPKPFQGRVTMLLTEEHLETTPFIAKQWRTIAPQVRIERIPGNHLGCITTHLNTLAQRIRAEIDAVKSFIMPLTAALTSSLS